MARMNWAADRGRRLVSSRGPESSWVEATGAANGRSEPARPKKAPAKNASPAKNTTPATKAGTAKKVTTTKKATPARCTASARTTPIAKRTTAAAPSPAGHPNRQRGTLVNQKINAEYHQLGAQLRDGHLKAAEAATRRLVELIAAERNEQLSTASKKDGPVAP